MQSPALIATGLGKTFTMHLRGGIELPVVANARFSLHSGTCAVLGGPSGAGKSSILKMLYGNYGASAGKIVVHHRGREVDLASADPRTVLELRRETIGYVTDHPILLLDEPTASLDAANRNVVVEMIAGKKRAGVALLGIFHDTEVRNAVADVIIDVTGFAPAKKAA